MVRGVLVGRAMRRRVRIFGCAAATAATLAAFACGPPHLPAPPLTGQPTSALVEVPYPPPPARVEQIPARPRQADAVWIDGEWSWRTRRWTWKAGRWVMPPRQARFSPWTTVRNRMGTLFFAGGTWRDPAGVEISEPEPLASSGPRDIEEHAPDASLEGGSPEDAATDDAATDDAAPDGSADASSAFVTESPDGSL